MPADGERWPSWAGLRIDFFESRREMEKDHREGGKSPQRVELHQAPGTARSGLAD